MKVRIVVFLAALALTVGSAASVSAGPITFFGQDLNGSESISLKSTPNALAAQNSFLANLTGVGNYTFESAATGAGAPLAIVFPGAGTATLNGGGEVSAVAAGTTNGFGRYSVPSLTSTKFWETDAGEDFSLDFSQPIAAFGFYGIDIGDFGGNVSVVLTKSGGGTVNLPVGNATGASAGGAVLFFGFYDLTQTYTKVAFNNTQGSGDFFAFDDFTIGSIEQVTPVPDPGSSLLLLGMGLVGLRAWKNRLG